MLTNTLRMSGCEERTFDAGERILEEGKPGDKVFVMSEGAVRVEIEERSVRVIEEPGTLFGEISTLLGRSRSATVTVVRPSRFYVIDDLPTFVRRNPEIAIELLRLMADRVVQTNRELVKSGAAAEKNWWRFWT